MPLTNTKIMLYHGSYCEVTRPDLMKCSGYKDFGQGFYLTTSASQAENFSLISLKKAILNGTAKKQQEYGIVSVFSCQAEELNALEVCEFETADAEWLYCVVAHRKGRSFSDITKQYKKYDVIGGKIANDATNAALTAYMAGVYGEVGSERAAQFCISLLLPERLKDQYCFRTDRAIDTLHFEKSYKVWK